MSYVTITDIYRIYVPRSNKVVTDEEQVWERKEGGGKMTY